VERTAGGSVTQRRVRTPAVAGVLYPADAIELSLVVARLLAKARPRGRDALPPKAVIVPHGGLRHSGEIAARAYAEVSDAITRVVIAGPVHHHPFEGIALPDTDAFVTPLGPVRVDESAVAALLRVPGVHRADAPHRREHAVEMQLPFLQVLLEGFSVVPMLVGHATREAVAAALRRVWGGAETLIVVTSDLSQHRPYLDAQRRDRGTAERIAGGAPGLDRDCACAATLVDALLTVTAEHGLHGRTLALANSGDTGGDATRVVGYGAFGFY
jgi:AmmeMemoRadiSam system protein B